MNNLSRFNEFRCKKIDRCDEIFGVLDKLELTIPFRYRKGKLHKDLSDKVKLNMRSFEIGLLTEIKPFDNF